MPVAIRAITRLVDADDVNVTPGVGVDEYALVYDHDTARFVLRAPAAAPDLSGYALLAGRAGGQTLYGGTAANDDITIHGTSDATRTTSYVLLQPTAGRVGIGTASPAYALDVAGTSLMARFGGEPAAIAIGTVGNTNTSQNTFVGSYGTGGTGYFGTNCYWNGSAWVNPYAAGSVTLNFQQLGNFYWYTGGAGSGLGTLKMALSNSGNLGIGISSAATALHVVGAATITGGIRPAADSTTALQLQNAAGTSVLNIDTTNARVGIGTVAPAEELDVVGDIGLTGNIIDRGGASADIRLGGTDDTRYLRLTTSSVGASLRGFGGSANNLALGSGTAGDVITILSTGLVGIGTTIPNGILHVSAANVAPGAAYSTFGDAYFASNDAAATGKGGSIALGGQFTTSTYAVFGRFAARLEGAAGQPKGYFAIETTGVEGGAYVLRERMRISSTGITTVTITDTADAAVVNALVIGKNVYSTGVGAAGLGSAVRFQAESSTDIDTAQARIQALWYEATHATRKADLVLTAYDTAEREGLRIRATGTTAAVILAGGGIRPAADSTTALQLQNAAGTSVLNVDTTNARVGIGTTAPLVTLHIVSPSYAHIAVERTSDKWIKLFSGNSIDGVEPTVTWKSSQNLWLVSSSSINDTAMSSGGVVISGANNYLGIGGAPSQPLRVRMISGGAHNSVINVAAFVRRNGFASAAGFGQSMSWFLESSTTENTAAASLTVLWYEATHATRKADLVLTAYDTAEREGLRIRGNGSAPAIGFLGATPRARIAHVTDPAGGGTVDAEARTAINSILATLELFGFHSAS